MSFSLSLGSGRLSPGVKARSSISSSDFHPSPLIPIHGVSPLLTQLKIPRVFRVCRLFDQRIQGIFADSVAWPDCRRCAAPVIAPLPTHGRMGHVKEAVRRNAERISGFHCGRPSQAPRRIAQIGQPPDPTPTGALRPAPGRGAWPQTRGRPKAARSPPPRVRLRAPSARRRCWACTGRGSMNVT